MRTFTKGLILALALSVLAPFVVEAQTFSDVTSKTFEKTAIEQVIARGWLSPQSSTVFGYGVPITPDQWLFMLMFLRTSDACPEFGLTPNTAWTTENIRACLSGTGVPVLTERSDQLRRDEAMQQLFALRRRSFAFQQLQAKPAGYVDPGDRANIPANRAGAMIAADRLKLIFRSSNTLLPATALFKEDAALSITRFMEWEKQGGADTETNDQRVLTKEAKLNHWRDLDTDIYVLQVKVGGDTIIKPIIPRRSFNAAKDPKKEVLRDEYVYQSVSSLAKESGALAAINGSYFNVQWPWGAFEDVVMRDGNMILERTDRSTFTVCKDGTLFIGKYEKKQLQRIKCVPEQMLGAGPLFLSEGQVLTESTKEGFDEYTQWERRVGKNARTAIGISTDRKTAYFIIVAGKSYPAFGRGGSSLGAFLKEKYPDLGTAMMYDGGSSSSLYAQGELLVGMGVSGNATERSVISALGVFSQRAETLRAKQFTRDQLKYWDPTVTKVKIPKPAKPFEWQTVKDAKTSGQVTLTGTRGSSLQVVDAGDGAKTFSFTFDLFTHDTSSRLTVARREGVHEKGWKIPTEIHVIDPRDGSDTDVIALLPFIPAKKRPDLKTFDLMAFRPTGIVFGDASGRVWFYEAKGKQWSEAVFLAQPKQKTSVKPVKK